jgi:DNA-directed RNA polymerase sigma subunit (sigma70/sigma32)
VPRYADRGTRDAETLRAYLREIGKLPRLTGDGELALGRRIQHDRDEQAPGRLVEGNLRFVVSYGRRYRGLGVAFLDLVHEGNLGLIEAAKRFDPTRNVWTLQQIGDRLHLTRERVRQIERAAKEKLRQSKRLTELRSYLN